MGIEEQVDNENHSILNTGAEIEDNEKEDQNTEEEATQVNDKLENNEDLSILNTQSSENKEDTSDDESVLDKDLTLTTKQNLKHEEDSDPDVSIVIDAPEEVLENINEDNEDGDFTD